MTAPEHSEITADNIRAKGRWHAAWVPAPPIFTDEIDARLRIWKTHQHPGVARRALNKIPDLRREFIADAKPQTTRFSRGIRVLVDAAVGYGATAIAAGALTESDTSTPSLVAGAVGAVIFGGSRMIDNSHTREAEEFRMQWREERLAEVETALKRVVFPEEQASVR